MKLLIAYDGSEAAEAALDDLTRAGLAETVEAAVITVADVFLPPPLDEEESRALYDSPAVRKAHEHATDELKKATAMSERRSRTD